MYHQATVHIPLFEKYWLTIYEITVTIAFIVIKCEF